MRNLAPQWQHKAPKRKPKLSELVSDVSHVPGDNLFVTLSNPMIWLKIHNGRLLTHCIARYSGLYLLLRLVSMEVAKNRYPALQSYALDPSVLTAETAKLVCQSEPNSSSEATKLTYPGYAESVAPT